MATPFEKFLELSKEFQSLRIHNEMLQKMRTALLDIIGVAATKHGKWGVEQNVAQRTIEYIEKLAEKTLEEDK